MGSVVSMARRASLARSGSPIGGDNGVTIVIGADERQEKVRRGRSRSPEPSFSVSRRKGAEEHVPWYLIDPDRSKIIAWDLLTGSMLIIVAIFTPFEVAFLPAPTRARDPLFVFGRMVDLVFGADVLLRFFVMVPDPNEPAKLVRRMDVIAATYLRGWFTLDIISLSSSVFDIVPLAIGDTSSGNKSPYASFRVVRILRLAKLIRLLQASRRIKEWSVRIVIPRATLVVCSTFVECLYVVHFFACMLGLVTIVPDTPLHSWFGTMGLCE
jgi:hypothetical protein